MLFLPRLYDDINSLPCLSWVGYVQNRSVSLGLLNHQRARFIYFNGHLLVLKTTGTVEHYLPDMKPFVSDSLYISIILKNFHKIVTTVFFTASGVFLSGSTIYA